ncbi:hypothetical protein LCGC14_2129040 [marine sediment metagenome]|uniref:Uncharacterized protein n=1 Tax=marine sediment metagenome TaxID=412755 RepID=A0A0F9GY53_9ZZZZ
MKRLSWWKENLTSTMVGLPSHVLNVITQYESLSASNQPCPEQDTKRLNLTRRINMSKRKEERMKELITAHSWRTIYPVRRRK